ncbi:MAG: fibronectin type III domain-containing protein [Thermodesulfobacteriota bacterium]
MKRARALILLAAAALLLLPSIALAGGSTPPPTGFKVYPSVTQVSTDFVRVSWETYNSSTATIRLAMSSNMSGSVTKQVAQSSKAHNVEIGGLVRNTQYYYTVTSDGKTSPVGGFKTALYINSGSSVSDFKRSWYYQALQYQGDLDLHAPLGRAAFLTTHNSYNAGVYSQNGSYIDPNQKLSIFNQLEVGIRAIEMDVHYTYSSSGFWPWEWQFGNELKLCHGNGDIGCHANDRFFTQGLWEVRDWLDDNPDQVVIIYIEDFIEGQYDKAISEMDNIIGDLVYKPGSCRPLPMDLTKNDVLQAGKQILLIGGNCATPSWAAWVFHGHFPYTGHLENFTPYPDCGCDGKDADYLQDFLVRIYEDRTTLSALFGNPGPYITAASAAQMAKCGVGAIGLDQVVPFDSRLAAQVWSWGENEPNDWGTGEDCAVQRGDGRFNDMSCAVRFPAAGYSKQQDKWFVTSGSYTWAEAAAGVAREFPGTDVIFAVPVNGYDNARLQDYKVSRGIDSVWLNYSDQWYEGHWYPGY